MPTYSYRCPTCLLETTAVRRVADRHDAPRCHGPMELFITPVGFAPPQWNVNYWDPATGQHVTSMRQRRYLMDKHDLVDAREVGEPDWDKMRQQAQEVRESAAAPLPEDLQVAMKREGLDQPRDMV